MKHAPALILASLLLAASTGCRTSFWKRDLLVADSQTAVYLERQVEDGRVVPQGFSHPARVTPEEIQGLLQAVRHRDWKIFHGVVEESAVSMKAAPVLAAPIARALEKAGPDERVRFLDAARGWRPLFAGPQGTSGVIFFTGPDEMNVAFDILNEGLSAETADPREVVFSEDPVTITGRKPELLLPPGASLKPAPEGKLHPRWLVIQRTALAALKAPPAPPAGAEAAGAGATAPQPQPAAIDPQAEALRRKLHNLDELRRQGTITQEEYEKARHAILLQNEP